MILEFLDIDSLKAMRMVWPDAAFPLFHAQIFRSINLSIPKNQGSRTIDDFYRLLHDYPQIGYATRQLALLDDDPSLDEPACPGWLLSRSPYLPYIFAYISRLEILCLSKLNLDLIVDVSVFMKELSSCAVCRVNFYSVRCSLGVFRLLSHSMANLQVMIVSSSEITDFTSLANASRRYSSLFKDEIDPDIVSFEALSYQDALPPLRLSIQSLQIDITNPSDFILIDFLASEYAFMKNLHTVYLRLWNVELNDSCHFVRRINNICRRHPSIQVLWLDLGRRDSWWRMPRSKSRIKLNVEGVATVRLEFSFSLHNVNQSAEIYMAILDTAVLRGKNLCLRLTDDLCFEEDLNIERERWRDLDSALANAHPDGVTLVFELAMLRDVAEKFEGFLRFCLPHTYSSYFGSTGSGGEILYLPDLLESVPSYLGMKI